MNKKEYMRKYVESNRERIKEQRREYYKKNKERILEQKRALYDKDKARDIRLRREYGISLEEYELKLQEQRSMCACCGVRTEDLTKANNQYGAKFLVVDHCHTTGKVRDLLCNRCNSVIGLCEEKPQVLNQIKEYVSGWADN